MTSSHITRRELLARAAVTTAGYALAAKPVLASAIQTPAEGLTEGMAAIPSQGIEMEAYFAHPEKMNMRRPVVLVVHEIFGLHEYIRDVCRRLAKEGYLAIAPNLYQRQGDVTKLASVDEILQDVVSKVPDDQVLADLDATVAWAGSSGVGNPARTAVIGFCWGGRIVWLYSAHVPAEGAVPKGASLKAGVAWYGRLVGKDGGTAPQPIDVAGDLHAPVLGLYGALDRGIALSSIDTMRTSLGQAGGNSQIVVFPGAPHGFHADYRESYRELAALEGWRQMIAWFHQHGML